MDVLKGRKYNIITFGCQMNEHDSETISGMLKEAGLQRKSFLKTKRTSL